MKTFIWMSEFSEGIAHIYAEDENGNEISQCYVNEGEEYSVKELQRMLNLPKRCKPLNRIVRDIYWVNASNFYRRKKNIRLTFGENESRKMGKYPDFKHRLHNR